MTTFQRVTIIETSESDRTRSLGSLERVGEPDKSRLPLAKVAISSRVVGCVAETTVIQTFRNDNTEPLEAVYVFPLPGTCVVSGFEMKLSERILRAELRERGAAQRAYAKAFREGKFAGIFEKERDNVFTIRVGNIPAGDEATVTVTLSERLPLLLDGTTELRLPLVVAPRYIPGHPLDGEAVGDGIAPDTDVVPDASRITPPLLVDGFDPQTDLEIRVSLATREIKELVCSQHAVQTKLEEKGTQISLARDDELLNRDFVLRWREATEEIQSELLVHRAPEGALYGMLSITPPKEEGEHHEPRDLIFVLDRSGSMGGAKFASAARSCSMLLQTLIAEDRFAILAFDTEHDWMEIDRKDERFHWADAGNIASAEKFLRGLDGRGGTEMDIALGEAISTIDHRKDPAGRTPILVLITDGEVGDESRILERIESRSGAIRIFTVGVDTSVNDGLLRRMAQLGRGSCSIVEPGVKLEETLIAIARDLRQPLVCDLRIEGDGAEIDSAQTAPSRLPDLFPSRASTIYLRLNEEGPIRITGSTGDGKAFERVVTPTNGELPAIEQLWARARIADLEDQYRMYVHGDKKVEQQIIDLSVSHGVLSRFTAFVVIDEKEVVDPDGSRRRIVQPVHLPARWEGDWLEQGPMAVLRCIDPGPLSKARVNRHGIDVLASGPRKKRRSQPDLFPKEIRKRFFELIQEIFKLFNRLVDDLEAGTIPSTEALESATDELRDLLEGYPTLRQTALMMILDKQVVPLLHDLASDGADAMMFVSRAKGQRKRLNDEIGMLHLTRGDKKTQRKFWKLVI